MSPVIAILGAESTGKTTLAQALAVQLRVATGQAWQWIPEYLREWVDHQGRTPARDEQQAIADEQTRRIEVARRLGPVVADTTSFQTAIYSCLYFDDKSLVDSAAQVHKSYELTLVMGQDVEWHADGLQRGGVAIRAKTDALLRQALVDQSIAFHDVSGLPAIRLARAVSAHLQAAPGTAANL